MNVAILIGVLIAVVIGVSLIPVIVSSVDGLSTATTPSSVLHLSALLPIAFVAILIIGAVGFIAHHTSSDKSTEKAKHEKKNTSPINVNYARLDGVERNIGTEVKGSSAIKRL